LDITLLEDEMATVMKMFASKGGGQRLDYGQFLNAVAPNYASGMRMEVDAAISKLKKLVKARARDKDLKDPFLHFDDKKVGWFDANQLQVGLKMLRIKLNEERTQLVFEAMDMNNDGRIDFNDFNDFFNGRGNTRNNNNDDDDDDDLSFRASSRNSSRSSGNVMVVLRGKIRQQWRNGVDYRRGFEEADSRGEGRISKALFKQLLLDLAGGNMDHKDLRQITDTYGDGGTVRYNAFLRDMAPSRRHSTSGASGGATSGGADSLGRSADRLRTMCRTRARAKDGNLRDPFRHFARSKTSFDLRDFKDGVSKLNLNLNNRRVVEELFQLMDQHHNGKVRFSEFAMFVTGSRYTDAEDKLRSLITRMAKEWDGSGRGAMKNAFESFDRADKGYINANDFRSALSSLNGYREGLTKREAEDLVLRFDNNGDDRVSWREFLTFVEDRMRLHEDIRDVVDRVQKKLMRASRRDGNPWRIFHEMDR
jgi:Ca2+-binding EF-hand superfamily protein